MSLSAVSASDCNPNSIKPNQVVFNSFSDYSGYILVRTDSSQDYEEQYVTNANARTSIWISDLPSINYYISNHHIDWVKLNDLVEDSYVHSLVNLN
jgi:hypothetical protein